MHRFADRSAAMDRVTLDNGLEAVCEQDRRIPFVAFRLCLLAGARHDGSLPGLAHLCEHLACDGGSRLEMSHVERMYRAGGSTHGSTSHDCCSFADILPATAAAVGTSVCAERLQGHGDCITDDDMRREARTLLQEHEERVNAQQYSREIEYLQQLMYPTGHPYHWPAGGVPDAIARIDLPDAVAFFRRWYGPERAVFVAVGDIDPDWFFRQLEVRLSASASGPVMPAEAMSESRRQSAAAPHLRTGGDVPYARTYAAYRLPGCAQAGWTSASLFAKAVGLGRSSPLRRELNRRGFAPDVRVYVEPRAEATTVAFVATASPETSRVQLETAFLEVLERVMSEEVGVDDVERARRGELIAHFITSDRLAVRAERLAAASMLHRWSTAPEAIEWLQHRSAMSILTEGRERFGRPPETVFSVGPSARAS